MIIHKIRIKKKRMSYNKLNQKNLYNNKQKDLVYMKKIKKKLNKAQNLKKN